MTTGRSLLVVVSLLFALSLAEASSPAHAKNGSQKVGANLTPTITSLSPSTVYVNGPTLTLTVNGTNFESGAIAYWEYNPLTTTFVSATKLTAQVPATNLTQTGSVYIYVGNPDGSSSDSVVFNIIGLDPYLGSISPNAVVAGTTPSPIILNGSNFMTGATVQWNGKNLRTTYINSGQIQFTPTIAELAAATIVDLSVTNPPPGGISSTLTFDVTYPTKTTVLDLPANDLVWDPYTQQIYASVPSSYGTHGNTIAAINPATGKVTGYFFAGSEPTMLAMSSDGQYLYVGLNGNGSVQRMILPKLSLDIDVSLGTSEYGEPNSALALAVSPGDPHTFAVSEGTPGCCYATGLYFFTDSTQLPDYISYPSMTDIVFPTSSTLYGYSGGELSEVTVNSSGGTLGQQWDDLVEGNTIQYANGLIYGSAGQAFNPATGLLMGTYDVSSGYCCGNTTELLPDSALNRVFVLGETPFFNGLSVTTYNLSRFTPIAVANLSQLSSTATTSFIPWGNNGLATILQSGCCGETTSQVVLMQSSAMFATKGKANSQPIAESLEPSAALHGGGNRTVIIHGSGFVPGSLVNWNGNSRFAEYVSPTQLKVYVPASDFQSAGSVRVVVTNPESGGADSAAPTFTIN